MKKIIFISAMFLFLVGCSKVRIKIGPGYQQNAFEGKKVGVIIHDDSISINYKGDVENEFGKGNTNELIKNYFFTDFPKHLQDSSVFSEVYMDSCIDKCDFKKGIVTPGSRDQIERKFYMPDSGQIVQLNNGTPDYILILQKFGISSVPSANVIMYGFVPIAAVPYKPVTYKSHYVLWDNIKGRMAGWGNCTISVSTDVAVTMPTWHLATGTFARYIFSDERLKYPEIDDLNISPLDKHISASECNSGCWISSKKSTNYIMCKDATKNEIQMNINGENITMKLDTANSKIIPTDEFNYRDNVIEIFYSKFIKVRLLKIIKSKCEDSEGSIKTYSYSGTLQVTYGDKKKKLHVTGIEICEK